MYSDSTHFIYEILQNADDHNATEIHFKLEKTKLTIQHNGDVFTEKNVKAITYFGASTSENELVKTGRFGIGFKSVFTFTATPIIISGNESFLIYDLYKIKEYETDKKLATNLTEIVLPFNHDNIQPDFVLELMPAKSAYEKIISKLNSLNLSILLFTSNLRKFSWDANGEKVSYLRKDQTNKICRKTTITNGRNKEQSFLVFQQDISFKNKKHKPLEFAFNLDKEGKIKAKSSLLYVLFQTTQETHLKFKINGPFRTNPSRENISFDDKFNLEVIQQSKNLCKNILSYFKEVDNLDRNFFDTMPLEEDEVPLFFQCIGNFFKELLSNGNYYKTIEGQYAKINEIKNGYPDKLVNIISEDFLSLLNDQDLKWIQAIPKKSRAKKFLNSIGLSDFTYSDLEESLREKFYATIEDDEYLEDDDEIKINLNWLNSRKDQWKISLYKFLAESVQSGNMGEEQYDYDTSTFTKSFPNDIYIFQCITNEIISYQNNSCKLPLKGYTGTFDDKLLNIDNTLSDSLRILGLSDLDEEDRLTITLKNKYPTIWSDKSNAIKNIENHFNDILLFIDYYKRSQNISIFSNYRILIDENCQLDHPTNLYIDNTFLETGLNHIYNRQDATYSINRIYEGYNEIASEDFIAFIKKLGIVTQLQIERTSIWNNQYKDQLIEGMYGNNGSDYYVNKDYYIPGLDQLLKLKDKEVSKIIWKTIDSLDSEYLYAKYRINSKYTTRKHPSQLINKLKSSNWIPDIYENFFEPSKISEYDLHESLKPYNNSNGWLDLVGFGKHIKESIQAIEEKEMLLKDLGFESLDEHLDYLEIKKRLKGRPISELFNLIHENVKEEDFPSRKVNDPSIRTEIIKTQNKLADYKEYEEKIKLSRAHKDRISSEIKLYLKTQYTNKHGALICQVCTNPMPFKIGEDYYFERVEIFKKEKLDKEVKFPYLALCPNCAAKYKYLVKNQQSRIEEVEWAIKEWIDEDSISIQLDNESININFTDQHFHDLKSLLESNE